MGFKLLKHSNNPFKVNGQTFGIAEHRTVIPNGPTMVSYSLLERSDSGGWEKLDEWRLIEIKEATGADWDGKEEYQQVSVDYIKSVAEDFYA